MTTSELKKIPETTPPPGNPEGCTYLVFWEQLVLCTVLRRRKNHFKNQNSCFFFQNQEALVCKPLFPHVSNAFSQQPLSYWQKCYSLNLSETRTLIRCLGRNGKKYATSRKRKTLQKFALLFLTRMIPLINFRASMSAFG